MAKRLCGCGCGASLAGLDKRRVYVSDAHRKASKRNPGAGRAVTNPDEPPSTDVADALAVELAKLGVAGTYEGTVAIGIARQLDGGSVAGAAYASLSKELDRRVDALRLKAERPDDPVRLILGSVEEKQSHLRAV